MVEIGGINMTSVLHLMVLLVLLPASNCDEKVRNAFRCFEMNGILQSSDVNLSCGEGQFILLVNGSLGVPRTDCSLDRSVNCTLSTDIINSPGVHNCNGISNCQANFTTRNVICGEIVRNISVEIGYRCILDTGYANSLDTHITRSTGFAEEGDSTSVFNTNELPDTSSKPDHDTRNGTFPARSKPQDAGDDTVVIIVVSTTLGTLLVVVASVLICLAIGRKSKALKMKNRRTGHHALTRAVQGRRGVHQNVYGPNPAVPSLPQRLDTDEISTVSNVYNSIYSTALQRPREIDSRVSDIHRLSPSAPSYILQNSTRRPSFKIGGYPQSPRIAPQENLYAELEPIREELSIRNLHPGGGTEISHNPNTNRSGTTMPQGAPLTPKRLISTPQRSKRTISNGTNGSMVFRSSFRGTFGVNVFGERSGRYNVKSHKNTNIQGIHNRGYSEQSSTYDRIELRENDSSDVSFSPGADSGTEYHDHHYNRLLNF